MQGPIYVKKNIGGLKVEPVDKLRRCNSNILHHVTRISNKRMR